MPAGGAVAFRKLGLIHRFPERHHAAIKAAHRWAGVATWLLSTLTVQLALPHSSVRRPVLTPLWQAGVAASAALVCVLLWVKRQPVQPAGSVLKVV